MVCGDTDAGRDVLQHQFLGPTQSRERERREGLCVFVCVNVCCLTLAACKYWSYSLANASNIAHAAEARSHQTAHARHLFISATRA